MDITSSYAYYGYARILVYYDSYTTILLYYYGY